MRKFAQDTRGSMAPLGAVLMVVVATGSMAAVNLSRATTAATELQDLADHAAIAAVMAARDPGADDAEIKAAATALARPLAGSATPVTLSVSITERAPAKIVVTAQHLMPVTAGELLGRETLAITRKAVARAGEAMPVCLLLLEPAATGAWNLSGGTSVSATNCVAQVNSRATNALVTSGSPVARMRETRVVGPASATSAFRPAPVFGQAAMQDPFVKRISWPSAAGACSPDRTNVYVASGSKTLKPGDYCGGINVDGQSEVTLTPGAYVLRTGSLTIGSSATVKGPGGVTIVMLDPNATFTLRGHFELVAPKKGAWRGIGVAVKPQPTMLTSRLTAGGGLQVDGAIYMPSQNLYSDGSNTSLPGKANLFVARTATMTGGSALALSGDAGLLVTENPPVWLAQ